MLERFGHSGQRFKPTPIETIRGIGPEPFISAEESWVKKIKDERDSSQREAHTKQLESFHAKSKLLDKDQKTRYMQMIGALQYVATVTRPDI